MKKFIKITPCLYLSCYAPLSRPLHAISFTFHCHAILLLASVKNFRKFKVSSSFLLNRRVIMDLCAFFSIKIFGKIGSFLFFILFQKKWDQFFKKFFSSFKVDLFVSFGLGTELFFISETSNLQGHINSWRIYLCIYAAMLTGRMIRPRLTCFHNARGSHVPTLYHSIIALILTS